MAAPATTSSPDGDPELDFELDRYFRETACSIAATSTGASTPKPFPLIVGVTGHRDLLPDPSGPVRAAVRAVLLGLKKRFGGDVVFVLSALAQGADQLVAEVAQELEIGLIAIAPMPLDLYRYTLAGDPDAQSNFERQWKAAQLRIVLPLVTDAGMQPCDKLQYEQLGAVLSRYSHILLALWDGQGAWATLSSEADRQAARGGTAHVLHLRAHAEREAEGFRRSKLFDKAGSRLDLALGGPVLHVVTPRAKSGGNVGSPGQHAVGPGDCVILREPSQDDVPPDPVSTLLTAQQLDDLVKALRHVIPRPTAGLMHIDLLNRQIRLFRGRFINIYEKHVDYLRSKHLWLEPADQAGHHLAYLRGLQAGVDTAAQSYQQRLLGEWLPEAPGSTICKGLHRCWLEQRVLRLGALFWFAALVPITVLLFGMYAHLDKLLPPSWVTAALIGYPALICAGLVYHYGWVERDQWQSRFQDYRALAEAMRVQIFWAVAAAPTAVSDHYLRMQRNELGWIQFALRGPALWATALALDLDRPQRALINECWIENQRGFFIGYDGKPGKAAQNRRHLQQSNAWSHGLLVAGGCLLGLLVVFVLMTAMFDDAGISWMPQGPWRDRLRDLLLVLIPTAPALAASFVLSRDRRAYEAHAHSYQTLGRLFAKASREVDSRTQPMSDADYQALIFDLGCEALAENAAWLQDHRQRRIEHEQY
jgi:hypothetical protein